MPAASESLVSIQRDDLLRFTHHDTEGKLTVTTYARVKRIDTGRGVAELQFPPTDHIDHNIVTVPFRPPVVRGMVALSSIQQKPDGTDKFEFVFPEQVPADILVRIS